MREKVVRGGRPMAAAVLLIGMILLSLPGGAGYGQAQVSAPPDEILPLPAMIRAWYWPTPSPSPSPTAVPGLSPTPKMTSAAWIPPEELFAAFGPGARQLLGGRTVDKKEITIVYPDRTRVKYDAYPETEYDTNKKTLSYSLLMEAYRSVFWEMFGIALVTPTPAATPPPVATPTPAGYKTPVPTRTPKPAPTPTRTPKLAPTPVPTIPYCQAPLKIADLENMWVAHTRSTKSAGWRYYITRATKPTETTTGYGYIADYENSFYDYQSYGSLAVAIRVVKNTEDYSIQTGDYITLTYDSNQTTNVYPPHISGPTTVYYYVDSSGATYSDELLCHLVQAVPTPTPIPSRTPAGYKTPTPDPYCETPLRISELVDMEVAHARSSVETGWRYEIVTVAHPEYENYGGVYDNQNSSWTVQTYPLQSVALKVKKVSEDVDIREGDWITVTFDAAQEVNVFLPSLSGAIDTYYYVGSDGATYTDELLCHLAKAVPSPTPEGFHTPISTPTAKTGSRGRGIPTPAPTVSLLKETMPPATPVPAVSSTPYKVAGPETFDLINVLRVGSPVWSVWADERFLYGGAGDGRVYIWERGPDGLYFQDSYGGYTDGNMYGLSGSGPAGRRLYGANEDGTVYAWDHDAAAGDLTLLAVLDQAAGFMYSVASDDGFICGANNDGNIYLWSPADFSLQTVLSQGRGPMLSVCLDDEYIYGSGADGALYLWARKTLAPVNAFSPSDNIMWSTAVDSFNCYGGGSAPAVAGWSKGSFTLQTSRGEPSGPIGSLSSDDRKYLYGAAPDGSVYAWSLADFSLQTSLRASGLPMNGVFADRYRPGESFPHCVFGASADGNIYIWRVERTPSPTPTPSIPPPSTPGGVTPTGSRTPSPDSSATPVPAGASSPPPSPAPALTPGSGDLSTPRPSPSPTFGTRQLVVPSPSPSPAEFTLLSVLSGGDGWMFGVYADGEYIYGANEDKKIYVWSRSSYRPVTTLTVPDCKGMLSVYADGDYIYGSNDDSRVYVWDRRNFSLLRALGNGQYYAESVFADGDYLYSANYDRSLYLWNRSDFSLQTKLSGPGGWLNSVYADTGRIYAGSGGADYNVYLWSRETREFLKSLSGPTDDLNSVRADGEYIYGGSADGNVYLWDYGALYLKKILSDPRGQVTSVIPQGTFIYASSLDTDLYVWEKPGLSSYKVLEDSQQPLQSACVDGGQIFAAARDGNIYIWQAPAEEVKKGTSSATPASSLTPVTLPNWVPGPTPPEGTAAPGDEEATEEEAFPVLHPTPPVYRWEPPAEPYDPHKKTLDYPLLQETYKKVYLDLFNIALTTPTPPPTPVPTAKADGTPTPQGYKTPVSSGDDVVINEVAWGGTVAGSGKQWIELHNYGSSSVSLNGWKLKNNTALWEIALSGSLSISAGGYFVLATAPDPTGGKVSYSYDSAKSMTASGNSLELVNATGKTVDTVNCSGGWFAGGQGISMERVDPEASGSTAANWNGAPSTKTYGSGGDLGTPGAKNSQQVSSSASGGTSSAAGGARGGAGAQSAGAEKNLSLRDYADWIDFQNGHYFKLYEWDLTGLDKKYYLFDYLPNTAFIYLVTGYKPTGTYFKENLLEMIRDKKFTWGGEEHCRYIADIAESYLAVLDRGLFSKEERAEIEEKFYALALGQREFYNYGNYAQGIICGLNAVVGYIIGGKRGEEMISWANRLLSYDDTWTLPENSRHYQGLFIREMLRVALYSNRMTIPDVDGWGVAWKSNFIRQVEWIIDTFPHNGFNPTYGRDYRQNYVDHFTVPLIVATTVLDDGNPDHLLLAREAKWLLQEMFTYGTTHTVCEFGQNAYGYEAVQWGPFAILLNPLYLYWFLNESLPPERPGSAHPGSRVVYRPMMPRGEIASVYDESLSAFTTQPDKIIHRTGWEEDALFLMLDSAYPAAKSGENKYSFANNILSLSYGPEEFLTGVTMNFFNPDKTNNNLADILGSYIGADLVSWTNTDEISRGVTRLKDGKNTWTREITLYKTGDRRIEVQDSLSRRGNVYWHFQGTPQWRDAGVTLDVNGTRLSVTWEGAELVTRRDRSTWSDSNHTHRWTYSGDPDHEVKLYRSGPGTIVTTFRGLRDAGVPETDGTSSLTNRENSVDY